MYRAGAEEPQAGHGQDRGVSLGPPARHRRQGEAQRNDKPPDARRATPVAAPREQADEREDQRDRPHVKARLVARRPQPLEPGILRAEAHAPEEPGERRLDPVSRGKREERHVMERSPRVADREGHVAREHELNRGDRAAPGHRHHQPSSTTPGAAVGHDSPDTGQKNQAVRPRLDLKMPERPLSPQYQRQHSEPDRPARRRVDVGQQEGQRQVGHQAVKRLVSRVDRLETAQRERDRRQRTSPWLQSETASVGIGRDRQRDAVKPHQQPVGGRDRQHAIGDQVWRVKRRDVAFRHKRHAQAHPVAPEWEAAFRQRARQLGLQRAVHPVGVTADRLETDEQATQEHADGQRGQKPGQLGTESNQ